MAVDVHNAYIIKGSDARRKRDSPAVGTPCNLADDVIEIRELLRVAAGRVHYEDVVSVAVSVRHERNLGAVGRPPGEGAIERRVRDLLDGPALHGHEVDVVVVRSPQVRRARDRTA